MISEIKKYHEQKQITKSEYIPPLLTWGIITFILCFALLTRMIVHSGEDGKSIEAFSENVVGSGEQSGVSQKTDLVLKPILELYYLQDNNYDYTLLMNVKKKICLNQTLPEPNELPLLQSKSSALRELIEAEKESDFHSMSLEGRKLIIYIIREIFSIYDYHLEINADGEIEEIVDQSGGLVYTKTAINKVDIYYKGLIIVLFVLAIGLILCITIAKKHRLFVKEVRCDGFNKKRYA